MLMIVVDVQHEPMAPRPHSATFLRAHSHTGFVPQSARPASVQASVDKLSVPKAATARDVCSVSVPFTNMCLNMVRGK